jgi:RNA polymerase sigma-70 factor (ECF subfamily)
MTIATREDLASLLPQLRAITRGLTNGNVKLADDLVRDTMVLALRVQGRLTPGTSLKVWLLTILHKRFHAAADGRQATADSADNQLEPRANLAALPDRHRELATFKRAFGALSPIHREALMLTTNGLSDEQVAEIYSCGVGAVQRRLSCAQALLKTMLHDRASGSSGLIPVERGHGRVLVAT